MKINTKKARAVRSLGTVGPWTYDDGNVFSEPLQQKRLARIMKRLAGEAISDDDRDDGEYPEGWICSTHQRSPSEDDDALIAYAVNSLAPMADEIDALRIQLAEAKEVLREVEWHQQFNNCRPSCPSCDGYDGHDSDCRLAKVLEAP